MAAGSKALNAGAGMFSAKKKMTSMDVGKSFSGGLTKWKK